MEIEYISPSIIRAGVVTAFPSYTVYSISIPPIYFSPIPDILWVSSPEVRELLRYTFF